MHDSFSEALSLLTSAIAAPGDSPATTPNTGNTHDYVLAVLILVGTVITAAATVLVATIQRDRSPRSTVPSNDRLTRDMVRELNKDKEEAERNCATLREQLEALKTACWRRQMDPNQMIQEVMASP